MNKTIVLGGGWVGSRIAISALDKYVVTKRTLEGVDSLKQLGVQSKSL